MGRPSVPMSGLPSGSAGPRIEIKPVGDWSKALNVTRKLAATLKWASVKAQLKVANEIKKKVKAHLRNQDLGWKPLSSVYAQRKSLKGRDPRILWSWGNYYKSIEVWEKKQAGIVMVGIKKGKHTKDINGKRSKLDLATIAAYHEFSSGRRYPRRPLWNPTIKEMGGAKGIKKMYINSLKYWLRMRGIPVSTYLR